MKQFFKQFRIFIAPIIVCFTLGEYHLRTNNSLYYQEKVIREYKTDIECLIFGASHNWRAINPKKLSIKSASLAQAGSAINIDFLLFDKYIDQLPNLKTVIFPTSVHSLEDERDSNWNKNHLLNIYHGINNYEDRIPFNHYFLSTTNFKNYLQKILYTTQEFNSHGFMKREGTTLQFDGNNKLLLSPKAESKIKNHERRNNKKLFLKNTTKFDQIIQECLNRNIKVVLLSPPKLAIFNNIKTPIRERRDDFLNRYLNIPNVFIWNEERTFENRPDLFFDLNHMNTAGADAFTPVLDSLLNTIID